MTSSVNKGLKVVKPVLSLNKQEAHTRVLGLYRAVYRYIPYILKYFDIPKSEKDVQLKLRELFYMNANVDDVRVIDVLVLKGFMELKEITHNWQQKGHVMANFCPTYERKPQDFLSKFLNGPE